MVFKVCTSALTGLAFAGTLAFGLVPSEARATAILDIVGGQVFGARDVDVDGTLYDVSFVEGSCNSLFNGCDEASDFTFDSESIARAAGQALLDQIFVDSVLGAFDSDPALSGTCPLTSGCTFIIPFGNTRGRVNVAISVNAPDEVLDNVVSSTIVPSIDTTSVLKNMYVVFSRSSTSIPEPSTLLLFGLGLVGLGLAGRRHRLG